MNTSNDIVLVSANCQGLHDLHKRLDVLKYYENMKVDILCLQDTHLIDSDIKQISNIWKGQFILNGNRTNARGTAFFFSNNFEYELIDVKKDIEGNLLIVNLKFSDMSIKIINLYSPNQDTPQIFENIKDAIESAEQDYVIFCGDLNMVLDPMLDSYNYININNPRSRNKCIDIIKKNNLVDVYRHFNTDKKRYTWRRRNPVKQARLDYIISSNTLLDIVKSCDILPSYRSDHSPVKINIMINKFVRGRGVFRMNTELLKNENYIQLINKIIKEEKHKYALPIYALNAIDNLPENEIQFTIPDDLFLETILLRIRGETVKFSSEIKKCTKKRENDLISDIKLIEENENLMQITDLLDDKKSELQEIRNSYLKGHIVRSRMQWLSEGEKPSKWFCSLEHKNYIDKTIKKVELPNGEKLVDQTQILKAIKNYYENLFANKDHNLSKINVRDLLKDVEYNKLSPQETKKLEGKLTLEEISTSLKNMKSNKTPGIDGFPSEFFKAFWPHLKHYVLRALNFSFEKGEFSISLRRTIITCLPKGNKSRDKLKNWRPLSMLSVLYKIASSALANRVKPILNSIISKSQTGYVPGRFIGESTRLIYDLMHYTDVNNIPGLLMLIDFEKAFDSISWNFLYQVLECFRFGPSFIKWIKLLNTNITASILQCGILSESFKIGRGCKQGDPISAYMYIICGEVLTLLLCNNKDIHGITVDNTEYILTQFADDTSLLLDGSQRSLQAALNVLEIFGTISGLRMNTEKTKLVWLGRKKGSLDKLQVNVELEWGVTEFSLLGLEFNIDLRQMLEKNYNNATNKIKKSILNWNRRYLTPLGKITIIKTLFISKLNHLFLTLPIPDEHYLKQLNNLFFKFIWNNGPDKIKRNVLSLEYKNGGLGMFDLVKFLKGLKATWIRRIVKAHGAPWLNLFESSISKVVHIVSFGNKWIENILNKISNPFWVDTLRIWLDIMCKQSLKSNFDLLDNPIWYNMRIMAEYEFYLPTWYNSGIRYIKDVTDKYGQVLPLDEIKMKFNNNNLSFLDYYRVRGLISKFMVKNKIKDTFDHINPSIPFDYKIIFKSPKGSKDFYKVLKNKLNNFQYMEKWNNVLNINYTNETWQNIFYSCFHCILDNNMIWFQYKILQNILGTNNLLYKIKISDNPLCRICGLHDETILHLLVECPHSKTLWKDIKIWIINHINIQLELTPPEILFGYINKQTHKIPLNAIFTTVKYYIFNNARLKKPLSIYACQSLIKKMFKEQEDLFILKDKREYFSKVWSDFVPMFN